MPLQSVQLAITTPPPVQVAVNVTEAANGVDGSRGLTGPPGPIGATGPQGPTGAPGAVQPNSDNDFSGKNRFAGPIEINSGSMVGGEIYYRDYLTGALAALPIGTDGQVLTASAGVPTWGWPVTTNEWTPLGQMTSDGMSNTFYPLPWVPPSFNGDTEEVLFRITANANTDQSYYLDFGLAVYPLETSVVSQSFADGPSISIDAYGGASGIMPPTTMIRTNDTFELAMRVPSMMLPYGVFDYMDPFSGPMMAFSSGSHFSVAYKIRPRSI